MRVGSAFGVLGFGGWGFSEAFSPEILKLKPQTLNLGALILRTALFNT